MKTLNYILSIVLMLGGISISAQQIYQDSEGIYLASNLEPFSGTFTTHFDNGNIKVENKIVEGVLNGITTVYHENGIKSEVRSYKNGRKDGTWYVWNSNGVKIAEANYKNDRKDGKWVIWDNEGNLTYEIFYEKGEKKVVQSFYGAL